MSDADRRLTELEIALTHQQATLDDLGDIVRAQSDRIDLLLRELARLARRLEAAEADAPPDADVRPPHW